MAKNRNQDQAAEAQTETTAEGTEGKVGGKRIVLVNNKTGEQIGRAELIKRLYNNGEGTEETKNMLANSKASSVKGAIVKILKEDYNHEIPYQIVFATLKAPKPKKAKPAEGAAEGSTDAAA